MLNPGRGIADSAHYIYTELDGWNASEKYKKRIEERAVTRMKKGSLAYVEFFTSDLEKTREFYSSVFGWRLEARQGWEGHLLFYPPEGLGGLFKLKPDGVTDKGPIVHVVADDIAVTLDQIKEAGGRTIIPMTAKEIESGLKGFFALAEDNVGNRIGLST